MALLSMHVLGLRATMNNALDGVRRQGEASPEVMDTLTRSLARLDAIEPNPELRRQLVAEMLASMALAGVSEATGQPASAIRGNAAASLGALGHDPASEARLRVAELENSPAARKVRVHLSSKRASERDSLVYAARVDGADVFMSPNGLRTRLDHRTIIPLSDHVAQKLDARAMGHAIEMLAARVDAGERLYWV